MIFFRFTSVSFRSARVRARAVSGFRRNSPLRLSLPAIDFVEREKEYVVSAELPGMEEKELEVKLSSGVLTIRGEKKEERKEEQPTPACPSGATGSFERSSGSLGDRPREDRREIRERSADDPPSGSEEALQKEKRIPNQDIIGPSDGFLGLFTRDLHPAAGWCSRRQRESSSERVPRRPSHSALWPVRCAILRGARRSVTCERRRRRA